MLLPVLGACAFVTWRIDHRWFGELETEARVLGWMLVFTAALVAFHLLPGVAGVFTPVAVLLTALAGAAAAWRLGPRRAARARETGQERGAGRLATAVALVAAGCALALVRDLAGAAVTQIDALNFQLPFVARWIQDDSIWGLHQFIPDYSNATYPMNGNVLVAAFVLPFESAFVARLVGVPYWALGALAVFAVARRVGAPQSAAVLAATAVAALPVSIRAGLEGVQTDAPMLACLGAGVLFLLRHARSGSRVDLVLAALGLGLAFGTKWYAVTGVPAVVATWALARPRVNLRHVPLVAGIVAAAGGFWLLRNWIETGNPLFPQPFGPFDAPRDTLRELGGFTLAHYLTDFDVWDRYLRPAFASSFGWTGAALVVGAAAAVARVPRGPVLALIAGTVVLAAIYVVTPYSAFGPEGRPVLTGASTRYGLPALMGAAVVTAWALGGLRGRWRTAAEVVLAVAVADGLRRGFAELSAAKVIGGSLAAAAAAALAMALRRRPRAAAAAAAVVLIAGLVAVDAVRRRANDAGYARFDPTLAWIESNAPSGARIGIAGRWTTDGISPVLPAFGPRFGNDVEFVGAFREDMLRPYEDAGAFAAALQGFDLLVVGRGAPPRPPAREETWARQAGWRPVAQSQRLALLRAP